MVSLLYQNNLLCYRLRLKEYKEHRRFKLTLQSMMCQLWAEAVQVRKYVRIIFQRSSWSKLFGSLSFPNQGNGRFSVLRLGDFCRGKHGYRIIYLLLPYFARMSYLAASIKHFFFSSNRTSLP